MDLYEELLLTSGIKSLKNTRTYLVKFHLLDVLPHVLRLDPAYDVHEGRQVSGHVIAHPTQLKQFRVK